VLVCGLCYDDAWSGRLVRNAPSQAGGSLAVYRGGRIEQDEARADDMELDECSDEDPNIAP